MSFYAANAIGAVVVGHSVRDALSRTVPRAGLPGCTSGSLAIVLVCWLYARMADRVPRGLLNAASALGCAAHAREAKRLFGLIGAGGTLANVIFGLLVARYAPLVGAQNLLLPVAGQLALCAALAQAGSRIASATPLVLRSRRPASRNAAAKANVSAALPRVSSLRRQEPKARLRAARRSSAP
jgi:hypothetical protein